MNYENVLDYSSMELDELKEYAKSLGITFGRIGREKLIERVKEKLAVNDVLSDDDLSADTEDVVVEDEVQEDNTSILESINNAIDELDESADDNEPVTAVELPLDKQIAVKSITFGGLTYKSRSTNAIFRWNQIGDIEYMTVAELNEMNNHKRVFLNKPYVILLDEDAIKKFRLMPVYENVAKINNLKKIFASDKATIEKTLDEALRVNMRDVVISKVRQMIRNKTLTDASVIKLIENKLKIDIMDTIE